MPRSRASITDAIYQPSGTNEMFAVLPKAARPKHDLYIRVMVYTPDNTAHAGTLLIEPDGTMQAYSQTSSEAQTFTSSPGSPFRSAPNIAHPAREGRPASRAFPGPSAYAYDWPLSACAA